MDFLLRVPFPLWFTGDDEAIELRSLLSTDRGDGERDRERDGEFSASTATAGERFFRF